MSTFPANNEFRDELTMPAPLAGSVCMTPESRLICIVGMAWYASVCATSPAHEDQFLSSGGSPFIEIGAIDEDWFEQHADDLPACIANLDTKWTVRRDKTFATTGLPLLRLKLADYVKHQIGATDQQRKDNSSSKAASQMRTCFAEKEQNKLCDEILHDYIFRWLSVETGASYNRWDVRDNTDAFLRMMNKLLGNGTLRIEADISSTVGYDRGEPVKTFYLEIDATHSHYHMYPATFSAEQIDRTIFVDY